MKKDITKLFSFIDDFVKMCEQELAAFCFEQGKKRRKATRTVVLKDCEIITILLLFQKSPCRKFKYFYQSDLQLYKSECPHLIRYKRFVAMIRQIFGLMVVTGIRKGMGHQLMPLREKVLLRKRSLIETVFDYLKNKFQLKHARHRSCFSGDNHTCTYSIANPPLI